MEGNKIVIVAATSLFEERRGRAFVVQGRSIGIILVDQQYFAFFNQCPHQGGPLCEGEVSGSLLADRPGEYRYDPAAPVIRCPWHGWEFRLGDGVCTIPPNLIRIGKLSIRKRTLREFREEAQSTGKTLSFGSDPEAFNETDVVLAIDNL